MKLEQKPYYKTAPFLDRIKREILEYKKNPMESYNCQRNIISEGFLEDEYYIEFYIKPLEGM